MNWLLDLMRLCSDELFSLTRDWHFVKFLRKRVIAGTKNLSLIVGNLANEMLWNHKSTAVLLFPIPRRCCVGADSKSEGERNLLCTTTELARQHIRHTFEWMRVLRTFCRSTSLLLWIILCTSETSAFKLQTQRRGIIADKPLDGIQTFDQFNQLIKHPCVSLAAMAASYFIIHTNIPTVTLSAWNERTFRPVAWSQYSNLELDLFSSTIVSI
jgi:hypothetical protein